MLKIDSGLIVKRLKLMKLVRFRFVALDISSPLYKTVNEFKQMLFCKCLDFWGDVKLEKRIFELLIFGDSQSHTRYCIRSSI